MGSNPSTKLGATKNSKTDFISLDNLPTDTVNASSVFEPIYDCVGEVIVNLRIIDIVTLEKLRNHLCRYHGFKLPAVTTNGRDTAVSGPKMSGGKKFEGYNRPKRNIY